MGSKIYTRNGDGGQTRLASGQPTSKASQQIDAIGTLDELNASIGLALAFLKTGEPTPLEYILIEVQHDLFDLGAVVADARPKADSSSAITAEKITWLESKIDELSESVPPLRAFILPGGTSAGAQLHVARTICRRTERLLWSFQETRTSRLPEESLRYVNRLSDLLFTAARSINVINDSELTWRRPSGKS